MSAAYELGARTAGNLFGMTKTAANRLSRELAAAAGVATRTPLAGRVGASRGMPSALSRATEMAQSGALPEGARGLLGAAQQVQANGLSRGAGGRVGLLATYERPGQFGSRDHMELSRRAPLGFGLQQADAQTQRFVRDTGRHGDPARSLSQGQRDVAQHMSPAYGDVRETRPMGGSPWEKPTYYATHENMRVMRHPAAREVRHGQQNVPYAEPGYNHPLAGGMYDGRGMRYRP